MGSVYGAAHVRDGCRVAIKILHRELCRDQELCSRFVREGYVTNRVSHPGTVHVLDHGVAEDGSLYFVMDLLEGETLSTRQTRSGGTLDAVEVVRVLIGLLDVLAEAHAKGIVHRDIKPENVFLTTAGQIKLLDFGLAEEDEDASYWGARVSTITGTPGFMSPEQALGRTHEVDALSDIWSVGATAFTLLSGQPPRSRLDESSRKTPERAGVTTATPLVGIAPNVPSAVARIVDRALAPDKPRRWPNARAMREALADALDAAVGTESPNGARSLSAPRPELPAPASSPGRQPGSACRGLISRGSATAGHALPARSGRRCTGGLQHL
jgi:serine/threonine-protein kinase